MNAQPNRTERRRHFDPSPRVQFAAASIIDNTKWVMPNGFAHAYCVAMEWELLTEQPDGLLFRAPEGFEPVATERLPD